MWKDIIRKNNRFNTEKEAVEYAIKLAKQTNTSQIVADVNMKGDFVVEDDSQKFSSYDPDYSYQDDKFIVRPNGIVFSTRTRLPSEKYHTPQELQEFERMRREEHTRKYGKFFENAGKTERRMKEAKKKKGSSNLYTGRKVEFGDDH